MALKHQALIHTLFLSFAPFLGSRQSQNIPFLQDSITWVWQRKKKIPHLFFMKKQGCPLKLQLLPPAFMCRDIGKRFLHFSKDFRHKHFQNKIWCREQNHFSNKSIPRKKHQCLCAYCTWVPHDTLGGRNSCCNDCAQQGEQGTDLSVYPGCQSEAALMFCLWYSSLTNAQDPVIPGQWQNHSINHCHFIVLRKQFLFG